MRDRITSVLIFLFVLLLPTQLGKHFFGDFSFVNGLRVDYLSLKIYLTDILALGLIILNYQHIQRILLKFKGLLLILFTLLFANILLSQQPIVGFYSLIKYVEVICVGIVFYKISINLKKIVLALTVGSLVEFFLSIAQIRIQGSAQGLFYFIGERYFSISAPAIAKTSVGGVEILRPYASFSHPNSLGGFYVLVYVFALFYKYFTDNNKYFRLTYVLLCTSSLLVLFSFSKNAILAWIIFSSFYLFYFSSSSCLFCKISRFLSIATLGGVFLTSINSLNSLGQRLGLIINGLKLFLANPILGLGAGQHIYALSDFPTKSLYFFNQPIHNVFFFALVEWGLLIFIFIVFLLRRLIKSNKKIIVLVGVIALTGFFDHYWLTSQQNLLLVPTLIGIVLNKTNPFKDE